MGFLVSIATVIRWACIIVAGAELWNYTYDFNYINDGWTSDKNYRQNTGYASDNYFRNHMDYVWTKSEVNRRFFNNRFILARDIILHGKIMNRKTVLRETC